MSTVTGIEALRVAENIVAQFHIAAVKQHRVGKSRKQVNEMATCLKVLRALIQVGDNLREAG